MNVEHQIKIYGFSISTFFRLVESWRQQVQGKTPDIPLPVTRSSSSWGTPGISQAKEDTRSLEFWVFPGASYQRDVTGNPRKGGVQEAP